MPNELLAEAEAVLKRIDEDGGVKPPRLAAVLLRVALPYVNSSEDLQKAPERAQFHEAVWRTQIVGPHGRGTRPIAKMLFNSKEPRWNEVAFDRFVRKCIKEKRIAAGIYALLQVVPYTAFPSQWGYLPPEKTQEIYTYVGRYILQLLVAAGALDCVLDLYEECPALADHSTTAAALLELAIAGRRLAAIRKLRECLFAAEAAHPLIAEADAAVQRLAAYEKLRTDRNIDLEQIDELKGTEFEHLVADQFVSLGYDALRIGGSGDFGADVKVETSDGTVVLVQCKRFRSKVNLKAVQEVVAALGHYGADIGIVITSSGFLRSAYALAESNDIELWDNEKLARFLTGDLGFSQLVEL